MDINNNKSLSLLDYMSIDFGSNSTSRSNMSFDEIYTKSTSSDTKYDYNKEDKFDKKDDLKDKINKAKDDFDRNSSNDKIGQSRNDNQVDAREKLTNDSTNSKDISKTDDSSEVSNTKKTDGKKEVKEIDKDNLTDEEKYKLSKIAELLGVPVNQLIDNMNKLQINIEDLTNGENIKDLIVSINGFDGRADLLTFDNLKETMESIQDIASEDVSEEDIQKFLNSMKEMSELGDETSDETVLNEQQTDEVVDIVKNENGTANQDANTSGKEQNTEDSDADNVEVTENVATDYFNVQQATKDASIVGAAVNNETLNTDGVEVNNDLSMSVQTDIKVGQQTQSFVSRVASEMGRSNVDTESVVKQLTESMKVEVKADVTNEIKIALRPAHLGDVTLKIITENGIVTAQFEAESQRVKEIIESNFNQLKQTLEEQGVSVGNLEVNVRSENQGNMANMNFGQNSNRNGNGQGLEGSDLNGDEIQETIIEESVALGSSSSFKA